MRLVRWLGVITLVTVGMTLAAVAAYILYIARLWTQAMREEGLPPTVETRDPDQRYEQTAKAESRRQ